MDDVEKGKSAEGSMACPRCRRKRGCQCAPEELREWGEAQMGLFDDYPYPDRERVERWLAQRPPRKRRRGERVQ